MQRIVHLLTAHGINQQAYRLHHYHRVARLDGDHYILEVFTLADAQKLHAALHDACRRVAIARHDAVGERTVVHSDAHGSVVLTADIEKRHELLLYLLQFLGIFLVGIFQFLECARRVNIVSGIYTHLLCIQRRYIGYMRIEMHVGNERCSDALLTETGVDVLEILCLSHSLSGETHVFSASLNDTFCLIHTCLGVGSGSGGHRLHTDGIVATKRCVADIHLMGFTAGVVEKTAPSVSVTSYSCTCMGIMATIILYIHWDYEF